MAEKHNRKLLVEGNDDQHVVWALCKKYNIQENFDVIDCKGVESLMESLTTRFKVSGIETIGIIVDADVDLKSRWVSLSDKLKLQGFDIPKDIPLDGLVMTSESSKVKKIGVWIMPNNNANGMLEDFISFLIPQDDKLAPIVECVLEDVSSKGLTLYKDIHASKAYIHTWLAWQETPGTPIGQSITKRYLTDSDVCDSFVNWLRDLFSD